MKKILIAASIVGAAAAGVILYFRKRNSASGQMEDAATDANRTMNKNMDKVNRNVKHAVN
jgi:hypothetical protein